MLVVQMGMDNSYLLVGTSYMNILPNWSLSQETRSQLVMRRQILLRNASLGNNPRQQKYPDSRYGGQSWTNIILSGNSHLQIPFKDRVIQRSSERCHVSCLPNSFWDLFTAWAAFIPLGIGHRNPHWVHEESWLTTALTNKTLLPRKGQWETRALELVTRSWLGLTQVNNQETRV